MEGDQEMGRLHFAAALLCAALVLTAQALDGGQSMQMRLSPAVSTAPGYVTVRINVETAADNRLLQVVAESPDFYRSSEISLDGRNSSALNVFEFRNLPTGLYHVTSVLVGVHGPRATAWGVATVAPSPGR
jgi:hypothetical protein